MSRTFAFSPAWVRAAEEATGELLTNGTLMQRAAHGLAQVILEEAHERAASSVVVLAGPGNNGGDALFAGAECAEAGLDATVIQTSARIHEAALGAVTRSGATVFDGSDEAARQAVSDADLIVDGILGIGAQPRDESPWDDLISAIGLDAFVIAVDCPTPGITADVTVTFGVRKTSHLLDPDAVGELRMIDIGLGEAPQSQADALVVSRRFLSWQWPVPGRKDHKYTRGVVGFVTGSTTYPGAAVLGTVAAASAGAGMVRYVGPQRPSDAVLAAVPEAVHGSGRVQAWVVGSGIDGISERASESDRYLTATEALQENVPVVLDAGALAWVGQLERAGDAVTVMTPHAGELANVLGELGIRLERKEIEADPVTWARRASRETGFVTLLKGGSTVIASPDERPVIIENRAPAWLATAGTGDVLAGLLGVLLAAGVDGRTACALGAYLHGQAARRANPGGPVRALAVAENLGAVIAELVSERMDRL